MTLTILERVGIVAVVVGALAFGAVAAILAITDHKLHTHLRHDREEQS